LNDTGDHGGGTASFVERRFDLPTGALLLRISAPYLAPGGEYRCRWTIGWPDGDRSREAAGIDGVQALTLALRAAHSELIVSAAYREGNLRYLGQTDLDLPPHFLDSLDDAGSQPEGN
jgi:hypothetical protein